MSARSPSSLARLLTSAPAGVAALGRLEVTQRRDVPWFEWPRDCDPAAVRRAAASVATMGYGELLDLAVDAAEYFAGPWSGQALLALPALYEQAPRRRAIAEAVAERFGPELYRGADLGAQQWWHQPPHDPPYRPAPCFTDFSHVYGNGEFTYGGLWTVTDPPREVHDALTSACDYTGRPTSRWLLRIRPEARVWDIDAPEDWVRLVERYPTVATRPHAGWELWAPHQHPSDTERLRTIPTQHALRVEPAVHVIPDWERVAADFDGVHLSWAGFLSTEGYVSELPDERVTMLRYWGSERTLWLRDVVDELEPLTAPALNGATSDGEGVDASRDDERRASDLTTLRQLLGRSDEGSSTPA